MGPAIHLSRGSAPVKMIVVTSSPVMSEVEMVVWMIFLCAGVVSEVPSGGGVVDASKFVVEIPWRRDF